MSILKSVAAIFMNNFVNIGCNASNYIVRVTVAASYAKALS